MAEHGMSEGGVISQFAPHDVDGRTEGVMEYLGANGELANDTWCQELNYSTIVERNLTLACRNILAGPPLPTTFMAIIQVITHLL